MTIEEALERVKRDRPGEATDAELIKWLSDADAKWTDEVILTHIQPTPDEETEEEDEGFPGYDEDTDEDTVLLIGAPDDEVYIYWLYAHIDMRLGELERYNNDATLYNTMWLQAAKRYNRQHMPLGRQLHHIIYGSLPVPRGGDDPLDQRRDAFLMRGW